MNNFKNGLAGLILFAAFFGIFSDVVYAGIDGKTASDFWHKWRRSQERYPIACWAYFQRFPGTVEEYRTYANANMTMVSAPLGHYENATAAGLKVLIGGWEKLYEDEQKLSRFIDFANTHKDVTGYQLMDEPRPGSFDDLEDAMKVIYRASETAVLPIVDMLPNWAWQRNMNRVGRFGYNYAEFMERFIRQACPPVLLNCHYPPMWPSGDRPEYYPNMEMFREMALRNDIGLMAFVLSTEYTGVNRAPSESDLYWQVYTSLAYGSKGIWYWNWRIKPDVKRSFTEGMVSFESGEPMPEYEIVKNINAEVLAIGDVLMKLGSRSVFHTGDDVPVGTRKFTHEGDSGWSAIADFKGDDFIVGEFYNQDCVDDESTYLMIVNKRHGAGLLSSDESVAGEAYFRPTKNFRSVFAYDSRTGKTVGLSEIESGPMKGYYRLSLGGGKGVLLRFDKEPIGRKEVQAIRREPTVDGVLNELYWREAVWYDLVSPRDRAERQAGRFAEGSFAVVNNGEKIFVACKFSDSDIIARGSKDDQPHYKLGDVAEIFLKPANEDWYWEIWLSPAGYKTAVFWHEKGELSADEGREYRLDIEAEAKMVGSLNDDKKDQMWIVEAGFDLEQLERPGGKDVREWLILAARQDYSGEAKPENRVFSAYPVLEKTDFHASESFAELVLESE